MYHFLIKANKPADPFFMKLGNGSVYFYCSGLNDLAKTLRCVTPKGFRVRSGATILSYFSDRKLILKHPWFNTEMYQIIQIDRPLIDHSKVEFENSFKMKHALKIVEQKHIPLHIIFSGHE